MKTKGLTIVERAIHAVPEFEKVVKQLEEQVELRGQSQSTLSNYIRRIALITLHFKSLPEQITEDEINTYLVGLALVIQVGIFIQNINSVQLLEVNFCI